jgi:dihydrofolate synthase / folylpolyglutamate synthase
MKYGIENIDPAYQKTLDYLYSFVDYSLQRNFRYSPEQFDLSRMFTFAAALGNPQNQYPIIHVAGTKGKGSVAALCASALQAAGYRTGLYTSPHLEDFNERIQVNRQNITHSELAQLVEEAREKIDAIPRLTFFEITTALAFQHFARQGVEAAVVEVGLGGRLDATNICTPVVSVITSLSYDHMAILGSTLAQIATEKAGIIKPGVPVVSAPQVVEAHDVLVAVAAERKAPLTVVGRDVHYARTTFTPQEQRLTIQLEAQEPEISLSIPLAGAHQVENAAVAYAALRVASQHGLLRLEFDAISRGFAQTVWPGRFEVLPSNPPIVLDCAHNRDSAHKLCNALEDYFPGHPVVLVFGASEDKDITGMLQELVPIASQILLVKSFHPRAADLEQLESQVQGYGKPVLVVPDIADAIQEATLLPDNNAVIVVTGSIFVVAGARMTWAKSRSRL